MLMQCRLSFRSFESLVLIYHPNKYYEEYWYHPCTELGVVLGVSNNSISSHLHPLLSICFTYIFFKSTCFVFLSRHLLRTGGGIFGANMLRWGLLFKRDSCDCGAEYTADHITTGRCAIYRPPEGINGIIDLGENTRAWLEHIALDV